MTADWTRLRKYFGIPHNAGTARQQHARGKALAEPPRSGLSTMGLADAAQRLYRIEGVVREALRVHYPVTERHLGSTNGSTKPGGYRE
jgi:hypothetical protein